MTSKPKDIGDLFKESFEDFEVRGDSSDWSVMEMKLEKLKFFRFDWTCFNIYYASLIALTFLFSSGILVDYMVSKEDSIQNRVDNKALQGSIQEKSNESAVFLSKDKDVVPQKQVESGAKKSDQPVSYSKNDFMVNKDIKDSKEGKIGGKESKVNLLASPPLEEAVFEDTAKVVVPLPVEKKVQKTELQKKIIYITKQDTLIVVDSVKTKNKRKK